MNIWKAKKELNKFKGVIFTTVFPAKVIYYYHLYDIKYESLSTTGTHGWDNGFRARFILLGYSKDGKYSDISPGSIGMPTPKYEEVAVTYYHKVFKVVPEHEVPFALHFNDKRFDKYYKKIKL